MRGLQNEMRKQALLALKGHGRPRLGVVTSYDPSAYAVKVLIQPEGFETGWLPIKSSGGGNGWGIQVGPVQGAQVKVDFQEGHVEAGICDGVLHSDQDRPLPVPAGEIWLTGQGGAFVRLTAAGLQISDGKGATATLANGVATIDATSILLGAGATEPVQLANGQPSTKVRAL